MKKEKFLEAKKQEMALRLAHAHKHYDSYTPMEKLAFGQQIFYDVNEYCAKYAGFNKNSVAFGYGVDIGKATAYCSEQDGSIVYNLNHAIKLDPEYMYELMFHEEGHVIQHKNLFKNIRANLQRHYYNLDNFSKEQHASSWGEFDADKFAYIQMAQVFEAGEKLHNEDEAYFTEMKDKYLKLASEAKGKYLEAKLKYKQNYSIEDRILFNPISNRALSPYINTFRKLFPKKPTEQTQQESAWQNNPHGFDGYKVPGDKIFTLKQLRDIKSQNHSFLEKTPEGQPKTGFLKASQILDEYTSNIATKKFNPFSPFRFFHGRARKVNQNESRQAFEEITSEMEQKHGFSFRSVGKTTAKSDTKQPIMQGDKVIRPVVAAAPQEEVIAASINGKTLDNLDTQQEGENLPRSHETQQQFEESQGDSLTVETQTPSENNNGAEISQEVSDASMGISTDAIKVGVGQMGVDSVQPVPGVVGSSVPMDMGPEM